MKARHVAMLMIVILVAVAIAYVALHQRAPDEPPTKIQSTSDVTHDGASHRA